MGKFEISPSMGRLEIEPVDGEDPEELLIFDVYFMAMKELLGTDVVGEHFGHDVRSEWEPHFVRMLTGSHGTDYGVKLVFKRRKR